MWSLCPCKSLVRSSPGTKSNRKPGKAPKGEWSREMDKPECQMSWEAAELCRSPVNREQTLGAGQGSMGRTPGPGGIGAGQGTTCTVLALPFTNFQANYSHHMRFSLFICKMDIITLTPS